MKVSKINISQQSFGQVRKSAAKQAIQETNGHIRKLKLIKSLVNKQKHNGKYDVIWDDDDYYYKVIRNHDSSTSAHCESLLSACFYAEELYQREKGNTAYGPEADILADEILMGCKK